MRTFGTISLKGALLIIDCEPHVAIRFRRVFARGGATAILALSVTPENCHELEWFLQRFPMVIEVAARAAMDEAIGRFIERRSACESIREASYKAPAFKALAVPAREYQRAAADLLLRSGSLLLADDLGIGKTCSAICCLTDARTLPALVVTLTALPEQWEGELARFAPWLRTHVLKKGSPYELTRHRGENVPFPDVIITNYHKLAGWWRTLKGVVRMVIFDEVQELRHGGTDKYVAAHELAGAAAYRMGLSATPIYNYGGEIWSVYSCISPGMLGSRDEFNREWCQVTLSNGREKSSVKKPEALGSYLREQGLLLRRTRAEVGRELPALARVKHRVESDGTAFERLARGVADFCKVLLDETSDNHARMRAGGEIDWRLRHATGVAKAAYVAEFVKLIVDNGEPVVLYGWHHDVYDIWRESLAALKPVLFTGQESPTQKRKAKAAFVAGESKVLIMSLRSAAGLDGLQGIGRTVVFGELDWSPGVMEQAIGRVHRDGQRAKCIAYYLVSPDGSDPVIADALNIKQAQMVGIRDAELTLGGDDMVSKSNHIKALARAWLRKRGGGFVSHAGADQRQPAATL